MVRLGGWGVTPAAAGVRVARGRDGRKWPSTPTYRKLLAPRVARQDGRRFEIASKWIVRLLAIPNLHPPSARWKRAREQL